MGKQTVETPETSRSITALSAWNRKGDVTHQNYNLSTINGVFETNF